MGEVVTTVKLMPEGVEVDLEQIKNQAQDVITDGGATLHQIEEEPIAFGLVSIIVRFIVDDKTGGTDLVEEKLSQISGVSSLEVIDVRLI